jgi:two-component system, OmpR family, heavy metal sensor histidine kinase CusS
LKKYTTYPFYQSLRFRFGLLFGLIFLCCLLVIVVLLYSRLKKNIENDFDKRIVTEARAIIQKTDINPLVLPVPDQQQFFLLTYNNGTKTDTLFNNLPFASHRLTISATEIGSFRITKTSRALETSGIINIVYAVSNNELQNNLQQLRIILFVFIPASLLLSVIAGYFFSGFLLQPVSNIIKRANEIDLQKKILLLEEPIVKDELHQLTETLNRMLERIKKQTSQQHAFFASASHELRTPLSNMQTELQVVLLQMQDSNAKHILENQLTEVKRLAKLVNDFLLMAQLRSGTVEARKENIDLTELVSREIEKMKNAFLQKKQVLKFGFYPADETFELTADKNHLTVIIHNLLENANKYGNSQSSIDIKLEKEKGIISIGISNETENDITDIHILKNEFSQHDFRHEGFGLGLWIVDQLTQINEGKFIITYKAPTFSASVSFSSY